MVYLPGYDFTLSIGDTDFGEEAVTPFPRFNPTGGLFEKTLLLRDNSEGSGDLSLSSRDTTGASEELPRSMSDTLALTTDASLLKEIS